MRASTRAWSGGRDWGGPDTVRAQVAGAVNKMWVRISRSSERPEQMNKLLNKQVGDGRVFVQAAWMLVHTGK